MQEKKITGLASDIVLRGELDLIRQSLVDQMTELRQSIRSSLLDDVYPVGSIFFSLTGINPQSTLGGQWQRIAHGCAIVGIDESDADFRLGANIGTKTHTLKEDQVPKHRHSFTSVSWEPAKLKAGTDYSRYAGTPTEYTSYYGGNQPHNNLQPYMTCYIFQRVS